VAVMNLTCSCDTLIYCTNCRCYKETNKHIHTNVKLWCGLVTLPVVLLTSLTAFMCYGSVMTNFKIPTSQIWQLLACLTGLLDMPRAACLGCYWSRPAKSGLTHGRGQFFGGCRWDAHWHSLSWFPERLFVTCYRKSLPYEWSSTNTRQIQLLRDHYTTVSDACHGFWMVKFVIIVSAVSDGTGSLQKLFMACIGEGL